MGVERAVALLLWGLCIAVLGNAFRAFLHPQPIRRPHPEDPRQQSGTERESLPAEPPGDKVSSDVDATRNGGGRRATNPLPRNERHHARRRGRCWLWRDAGVQWQPGRPRNVAGPGYLAVEGPRRVYLGARTKGHTNVTRWSVERARETGGNLYAPPVHRQHERGPRHQRVRGVQPAHDEGTTPAEGCALATECIHSEDSRRPTSWVCNCPPNGYPRSSTNSPTVCRGVSRLAT
jgi:hypothetical protein